MTIRLPLALAALFTLLFAACSEPESDADAARSFEVLGYVEAPLDERNRLRVDHEDVPGLMPPMVMLFNVADPDEARVLEPGDQIRFTFRIEPERSWIESIEPTGVRRDPSDPSPSKAASSASLLQTGEPLPDYAFVNEEGETVRLSDYRGRVVALTFIFTRCPVPEYCPAMMRNFGDVAAILQDGPPIAQPWQLVAVSFDPEHDTPEVMKRYGDAFGYDPQTWDLLTSQSDEPIQGIAANLGLKFAERAGSFVHNLRTAVIDAEGRLFRVFTDETWSPEELAEAIRAAAR